MSNATLDKDSLTKAPGTARMTISKTTSTLAGNGLQKCEKLNRNGTVRWVPASNATLDKDTLTKAPGNARMTISKSTVTFAGMGVWPPKGLKKSVM